MKTAAALFFTVLTVTACRPQPPTPGGMAHATMMSAPRPIAAVGRQIMINGQTLSPRSAQVLARLEAAQNQTLPDGSYWYDHVSGAAGRWGGPTENYLPAGLELGPSLPRNASGGRSGIIVNNRELHDSEVRWLTHLFGVRPNRGRYWLDANGNVGLEGGRALGNIVVLARQKGSQVGGSSWGHHDSGIGGRGSIGVAGDGQTTCVNTAQYTRCY